MRGVLSQNGSHLLGLFSFLLALSLFLANSLLLYMSLVPLLVLLLGLMLDRPTITRVEREGWEESTSVGDVLHVSVEAEADGGAGDISLYDHLPDEFQLLGGTNYVSHWKGRGTETIRFDYRVECSKRGMYEIPATQWKVEDAVDLRKASRGSTGDEVELRVYPRLLSFARVETPESKPVSLVPGSDISRRGVTTTEFKDIRAYNPGDPAKNINWKATARTLATIVSLPMVNEYEKEERKTVWVYLNVGSGMKIGNAVSNVFEHAVTASYSLAYYFLMRNYKVGLYSYNGGGKVSPEKGRRQFDRISEELLRLQPEGRGKLENAVAAHRPSLVYEDPMTIVLTSLLAEEPGHLVRGVRRLAARGRRTRKPNVLVVNVEPEGVPREGEYFKSASEILSARNESTLELIREMGGSVYTWNVGRDLLGILPRGEKMRA